MRCESVRVKIGDDRRRDPRARSARAAEPREWAGSGRICGAASGDVFESALDIARSRTAFRRCG